MNETLLKTLTVTEAATLRDAMLVFEQTAIRMVLICDGQRRLIGLATEGDVRRALLEGQGLASLLLPHANRQPIVGRTSMTREELVSLLSERVHDLPVLDEQDVVQDVLIYDRRSMIPVATPTVGERELRYVTDAVLSGWISSQGKYIGQFEDQFAAFCGTQHAVAVSNGTVALHLALTALGIGPGDEVIVPALTFVATASVVRHCHAKPVFVDVHPDNWNLDPDEVRKAITPQTRAIIPVHLYGQPCDMDPLMEIARQHKLWVIEDAAEAHGASLHGKRVGSLGHVGCFSFYGNKIITTGEGGMIVTNDPALNLKLRVLRDHGMNPERRYWHDVIGFNYRMTNLQAAIGVAQLERWDQIIEAKQRIGATYECHLRSTGVEIAKTIEGGLSVCWLYTLLLPKAQPADARDEFMNKLREKGFDCRPIFHVVPSMPPYFESDWPSRYPVAADCSMRGVSLPSSVELQEKELTRICDEIVRQLI